MVGVSCETETVPSGVEPGPYSQAHARGLDVHRRRDASAYVLLGCDPVTRMRRRSW